MSSFNCRRCGVVVNTTMDRCPECGARLPHLPDAQEERGETDVVAQRVRALEDQARAAFEDGDLGGALHHAREALALRPDSSTHALLGFLYERARNAAAAHYHFQAALQVTPTPEDSPEAPVPEIAAMPAPAGRWMPLVLIGCVLVSSLAVMFRFWPAPRDVRHGTVFRVPVEKRAAPPGTPGWTRRVPAPAGKARGTVPAAVTPGGAGDGMPGGSREIPGGSLVTPAASPEILGPSTRSSVMAVSVSVTQEQADEAYFRGEYERAITMYEAILQREEQPHPRLYQDLALCYHRLGNAAKAAEHLDRAVQGYRAMVAADPGNATARQGQAACEAALRAISAPRATAP